MGIALPTGQDGYPSCRWQSLSLNPGASPKLDTVGSAAPRWVGVVMLSPDYPLLVDAGRVSRSDDYHVPRGFLRRRAHSHSLSCLRTSLRGWSDRVAPVSDLRSPRSRVLPLRAGKASRKGTNMTLSPQMEVTAGTNVVLFSRHASGKCAKPMKGICNPM